MIRTKHRAHRGHKHLDQFNARHGNPIQIGFVNSSKRWVSRQVQLPLRLFSLGTDIPPRRLAPVQPPPVIPGVWRLPRERAEKPDVSQRESTPIEQPGRLQQTVPPPAPALTAATFEVHEALPVEPQQPPIINTPVESDATASQVVGKRAGSKRDIATLLGSKSSLREAILIREILGPPRGLQADIGT